MAEQLDAAVSAPVPVSPGTAIGFPRGGASVPARASAVADWFGREAFLVVLFAIYVVGLTWNLPGHIASDTWMTFAYGREIVDHGLPHHALVTVWAQGRTWIDQQWLGQLVFYGAYALAGIRGAIAVQTLCLSAAMALAIVAARRHGGSTRSVTWITLGSFLVVAWGSWTLRVQSLVFPLFVALLWLLAEDSRRPSRRVLLALPIVVLWATLHGTAFLASALVALRGLSMLLERDRPLRDRLPLAAVLTAAPALLLASPYGFSLVGYYHKLLLNPAFGKYVTEWAPTKLGIATAPRSEEHTSELQSQSNLVCRLLLEKKNHSKHTASSTNHHHPSSPVTSRPKDQDHSASYTISPSTHYTSQSIISRTTRP